MGDLPPELVQFKIEPIPIPATNIVRDGKFPNCRGGLGDIWKCSMTTQSGTRRLRVRREAYVWIQLEHDHILPLEGVTVAEEFGPLPALVSPWMEEGSLDDYLKREFSGMSDSRKRELVTAGISYLHSKDVVHGDLTAVGPILIHM
ncbi:hypothetical protein BDR05DRAFT_951311 [Suillus weaverae]|nr:hypothetical protein BDR05DRAFT_951311 [Suillus weaverae]